MCYSPLFKKGNQQPYPDPDILNYNRNRSNQRDSLYTQIYRTKPENKSV